MSATYRIPAASLAKLESEIEKLNKRAKKLSCEPIQLVVLRTITETRKDALLDFDYEVQFVECELKGTAPKLAGWSLVASIEPVPETNENLIREVPGEKCPNRFRTTDMHCDHCKIGIRRKAIFVLKNGNDYKQVGRACIADFLGHQSPESLLNSAKYQLGVVALVSAARDSEKWADGFNDHQMTVPTSRFMTVAAMLDRKLGFVTRSQAKEEGQATADLAWDFCTQDNKHLRALIQERGLVVEPEDRELAGQVIEWGKEIDKADSVSSYLHDVGVCCRAPNIEWKMAGYAASALSAYQKELVKHVANHAPFTVSKHLGTIDVRQVFEDLTITNLRPWVSDRFTMTLVSFLDKEGNSLFWAASKRPSWLRVGKTVTVTGTVTKHSTFAGRAQTELKRVVPREQEVPA